MKNISKIKNITFAVIATGIMMSGCKMTVPYAHDRYVPGKNLSKKNREAVNALGDKELLDMIYNYNIHRTDYQNKSKLLKGKHDAIPYETVGQKPLKQGVETPADYSAYLNYLQRNINTRYKQLAKSLNK